jgi:hypothetical protein
MLWSKARDFANTATGGGGMQNAAGIEPAAFQHDGKN